MNDWLESLKKQWSKLTESDLDMIGKDQDRLIQTLQDRYGWNREKAEAEVDSWKLNRPNPFA